MARGALSVGAAAYNRGSRAIRAAIDRERDTPAPCGGRYGNTPGKLAARCGRCGRLDYEANEGDRCTRMVIFRDFR